MPPKKQKTQHTQHTQQRVRTVVDRAKFHPLLVDIVARIVQIDQLGGSCVPMDADKCHYEFCTPADRNKARDAGFPTARLAITHTLYPHTKPSNETEEPPKQPPPDVRVIYIPERRREDYKNLDRSTLAPRQIGTIGIALRASPFVQFPAGLFADAVCMGHKVVRTMFEPFARMVLEAAPHLHIDAMLLYIPLFVPTTDVASTADKNGYGLEKDVWVTRRDDALKVIRDTVADAGSEKAKKELLERKDTLQALRRYIGEILAAPVEEEEDSDEEKEKAAEKNEDVAMKDVAE